MARYGYHRTSTKEQHLDRGIMELERFCRERGIELWKGKVYTDQATGKNFERPKYQILKQEVLEPGDVLLVTEIDRLGRNKEDTLKELQYFKNEGIRVMVLEIPTTCIDYSVYGTSIAGMLMETVNNMLLEMFASLAQAEMEKREKRQREGIEAMKARGEWERSGRPRLMKQEEFNKEYQRLEMGLIKPFELMRELGMSKGTFYRYCKSAKETERG